MYKQFIVKLETGKSDILDKEIKDDDLILSSTINIPLISLGFHSFIHRTKSAMNITEKLQTKKKIYLIVNPYETTIPDYDDSIKTLAKEYFNSKEDRPAYDTPEFYELWEILFLFNMASSKDLSCGIISNDTTNYSESLSNFRDKFISSNKTKIYNVTDEVSQSGGDIESDTTSHIHLDAVEQDGGAKKKKTSKSKIGGNNKMNVNTFNKSNLDLDLIIATTFTTKSTVYLYYEQENYKYIISRMISVLNNQSKGGSFILKIHESFTKPTIKLIYLLSSFYEETSVYKPLFSRPIDSSKYIIFNKFKYDSKSVSKKIKSLENIYNKINANSNKFVFDVYPDLDDKLTPEYIERFKFINIKIANQEQIMINDMVVFINGNNYFGESYHKYKNEQIEATKSWISSFFPPSKNLFDSNREELNKSMIQSLEKYEIEYKKLNSVLVK